MNRPASLEFLGTSASPAEAAAVLAAVQRFLRDTAPPPAGPAPRRDPWLRAARLEGVACAPTVPPSWNELHPWAREG